MAKKKKSTKVAKRKATKKVQPAMVRAVSRREAPVSVKIISVLYYIGAAFSLIGALALLFGSAAFVSKIPEMGMFVLLGTGALIALGIILLAMAILDYFIARGLWRGQSWSRILVIILAALAVIGAIISLQIISLIISGVILWYLGWNKEAQAYFN